MEHLPIVIFVFLVFSALAGILFQQIENKKKKIKELESEIGFLTHQYNELDELKADAELTDKELCKSRKPADPQYVDEWFRFKKMF